MLLLGGRGRRGAVGMMVVVGAHGGDHVGRESCRAVVRRLLGHGTVLLGVVRVMGGGVHVPVVGLVLGPEVAVHHGGVGGIGGGVEMGRGRHGVGRAAADRRGRNGGAVEGGDGGRGGVGERGDGWR